MIEAGDEVWFTATREPTEMHVWKLAPDGSLEQVSDEAGQHGGVASGSLAVVVTETVDEPLPTASLVRDAETLHAFERVAETARDPSACRPSSRRDRRSFAPRCSRRADASPPSRSRCYSIRTEARTGDGSCAPSDRCSSHSGSPTRGSPCS